MTSAAVRIGVGTPAGARRGVGGHRSIAVRTNDGWLLAASQNTTHRRIAEKPMRQLVSRQSD